MELNLVSAYPPDSIRRPDQCRSVIARHLLLTLCGCNPDRLTDESLLVNLVRDAATISGATVLEITSRSFKPQGFTAIALLAESHASLHTYPERRMAFWDCFTCGSQCDPSIAIDKIIEVLQPEHVRQELITRPNE